MEMELPFVLFLVSKIRNVQNVAKLYISTLRKKVNDELNLKFSD